MATVTMDGELFRALRSDGMSEELAAKWARFFARREDALKADIAELHAKIPDREADREVFAAKSDVAVLQNKVETVGDAIISIDKRFQRIDERFDRMDATIVEIKETAARTDERISGICTWLFAIFLPLHHRPFRRPRPARPAFDGARRAVMPHPARIRDTLRP